MEPLKTWLAEGRGRHKRLAEHIGVVPSFVTKMAAGDRPIPFHYGAAIEQFTGGAITRQQLFPDEWARIWPELATQPADHEATHG